MKLFTACFLMMALASGISMGQTFKSEFGKRYDELDLSEVLINADRILVCVPVFYKYRIQEDDDRILFELQDVKPIPESGEEVHNPTGRLVVVISTKHSFDGTNPPILLPKKKFLVFLGKRIAVDDQFRTKFGIEESEEIFQLCNTWQAAICLDFSVQARARSILKNKYGIDDPDVFLDVVRNLSCWRMAGRSKEEAIQELLSLLNSEKRSIYQENIPKILHHLGVSVVKKDNQFIIQEKAVGVNNSSEQK